jgi:hypothetical protein
MSPVTLVVSRDFIYSSLFYWNYYTWIAPEASIITGSPKWPASTTNAGATMIFNIQSVVVNHLDEELLKLVTIIIRLQLFLLALGSLYHPARA